jgi:RNA ligase
MNYTFPLINNISDVLPAIEGRPEFVVAVKDGYTVINYNVAFEDTFGKVEQSEWVKAICQPEDWKPTYSIDHNAAIRRECRGIMFDNETGDIIRRPYHKFFNIGERDETLEKNISLTSPHMILEKLDGSMIAPFMANGKMIWGTKMGATDVAKPVEEFIKKNRNYITFAETSLSKDYGITPIFEWCSRKQRIVMDYPEDQLVLTAARNMRTGEYISYDHLKMWADFHNIPLVKAFPSTTSIEEFVNYVRDLKDCEGFVVRFNDGQMVKAKCQWYIAIHRAKEAILQDRHIVSLILDVKLDDIKAHLTDEDRIKISNFESKIVNKMFSIAQILFTKVNYFHTLKCDRKRFAVEFAAKQPEYFAPIMFKLWDDNSLDNAQDCVYNTIKSFLGSNTKYGLIRDVWFEGISYND